MIAEAIETAAAGFSSERESQKIIVIMTDGENHEGDPIAAARQAKGQGAVTYTVGFGSPEGAPVPEYDERGNITGSRQDAQGRALVSRLDEVVLQQIADSGGGKYFRSADHGAIAGLADEIASFENRNLRSEFNQRKVERFQLFLLAGALCLFMAEMMAGRFFLSAGDRRSPSAGGAVDG